MNLLLPWLGVCVLHFTLKLWPVGFQTLFLLNIWLISMPHTFSTFLRSDRRSLTHLSLGAGVIACFAAGIFTFMNFVGIVVLYSIYFLWQQFHYARQNYGISNGRGTLDQVYFLGTGVLSVLCLFSEGDQNFFGYLLHSPFRVQKEVLLIGISILTCHYLLIRPGNRWHALSHVLIFTFAYSATEHFAQGWLYLNLFHNLQYLKFMHQHEKKMTFIILPLCMSAILFGAQNFISLPLSLTLVMALNFSHYTFDAFIWKKHSA